MPEGIGVNEKRRPKKAGAFMSFREVCELFATS
jgi:hypothetical protein